MDISMKLRWVLFGFLATVSLAAASDRRTVTLGGQTYPVYESGKDLKALRITFPIINRAAGSRRDMVRVGALVDTKGNVVKTFLEKADAEMDFQEAALKAVREWKFPIIRDHTNNTPISYVVLVGLGSPSDPASIPPKLSEILSDSKFLRSAIGTKALLVTNPQTGEVQPDLLQDIKSAGLTDSIEFIALPKDSTGPTLLERTPPKYPEKLKRKKTPGSTRVLYIIGADGIVKGLYCVSASHPDFAQAAAIAISQWRFEPARVQGTAVPVVMNSTLEFTPN